jgi:hypothetical protein
MLEDLGRIKEAVDEVCREGGMRRYKVVRPPELLGIRAAMDEDELIQILGGTPCIWPLWDTAGWQRALRGWWRARGLPFWRKKGERGGGNRELPTERGMSGYTVWCQVQEAGNRASPASRSGNKGILPHVLLSFS